MLKYYKTLYSARKYGLLGYNIRDIDLIQIYFTPF